MGGCELVVQCGIMGLMACTGRVAGPPAPPPPPAAAPPAPPAEPHVAPGKPRSPSEHHAAEDGVVPPPPPDEPSTARASEGRAAGSTQPDEAPNETACPAPAPKLDSTAPPPPPPQLAPPAGASKASPSKPPHLGSHAVTEPAQVPISGLTEVAPDGKVLRLAEQLAPLLGVPAQNGHATGTGSAAPVQVSADPPFQCTRGIVGHQVAFD